MTPIEIFLLVVLALSLLLAGFIFFMMWWLDYYAHQRQAS